MFGRGQKDGKLTDTIDTFVARIPDVHPEMCAKITRRLTQLELATVEDLTHKTRQFFQRELGRAEEAQIYGALRQHYDVTLTDLHARSRAPGDPPRVDARYGGAPRFE